MPLKVHVDPSSFERSDDGLVTGIVFIEVNDVFFPDRVWNDFVAVVLSWWLEALDRVLHSSGQPQICAFMDGPLQFEIQPDVADQWIVKLVDRRRPAAVIEALLPRHEVTEAVKGAARVVLDHCKTRGWTSRDIDTLAANYSRLVTDAATWP